MEFKWKRLYKRAQLSEIILNYSKHGRSAVLRERLEDKGHRTKPLTNEKLSKAKRGSEARYIISMVFIE